MKLIINADDFGIDIDRDIGIFFGVLKGYITSVSVIVTNKISFGRKIMIKIMRKKASIGIHINLTDNPLSTCNVEELYKKEYNYKKNKFLFWKNSIEKTINIKKIKTEIISQIENFNKMFGFFPEHIDGHNHCNIFNKDIEEIFEDIAFKHKIHLRIPYEKLNLFDRKNIDSNVFFNEYYKIEEKEINDKIIKTNFDYFIKYDMYLNNYMSKKNCQNDNIIFIGTMYGYYRTVNILYKQLTKFKKNDTIQIMTHPGFYWKIIKHRTPFSNKERVKELKVLKNLRKKLKEEDFKYISYKEGID